MLIKLDFQSEIPIYLQLYQEIIKGIATKNLLPGDPLPSVRVLAEDLGINLHTVNKAYNLLKQEGYLQIHRQKGVEINPDGMPKADKIFLNQMKEKIEPIIAEAMVRNLNKEDCLDHCRKIYEQYESEGGKRK